MISCSHPSLFVRMAPHTMSTVLANVVRNMIVTQLLRLACFSILYFVTWYQMLRREEIGPLHAAA
jgi:hypothetical protein